MGKREGAVQKLVSQGFSKTKAERALKESNGDYHIALRILCNKRERDSRKATEKLCLEGPDKNDDINDMGDFIGKEERKHPCMVQYKRCRYGKFCLLRDFPGDVCINYFNGACLYGNCCKKRHYVDGVDIRTDRRPDINSGIVKHQLGVVSMPKSCGAGVFVGDVRECNDREILPRHPQPTPEPFRFNLIEGSEPTRVVPDALEWQSRAASATGNVPTPFLEAARKRSKDSGCKGAAAPSFNLSPSTLVGTSRRKHPCIAQCGFCKYGKSCLHSDRDADVCVFFLNGRCTRGASCQYRHENDADYLRRVRPDVLGEAFDEAHQRNATAPPNWRESSGTESAKPCKRHDATRSLYTLEPTREGPVVPFTVVETEKLRESSATVGPAITHPTDDDELIKLLHLIEVFDSLEPRLLLYTLRCADGDTDMAKNTLERLKGFDPTNDINFCLLENRLEEEDECEAATQEKHEWFLAFCSLFPGIDTSTIQAVLDSHEGNYAEAYDALLIHSGLISRKSYGSSWSGKIKRSEEGHVEKLREMYPKLPKEVVRNALGASDGKFSMASEILDDMTKVMFVEARESSTKPPLQPDHSRVDVSPTGRGDGGRRENVLRRGAVSSPSCEDVESLYRGMQSELREFGDWRRMRQEARAINGVRIRVLEHAVAAYRRGDGEAAKALSLHGKELGAKYARLNQMAMVALETERLKRDRVDTLDLHGFYVRESVDVVRRRVRCCLRGNIQNLRIITGRGRHSPGGHSVLHDAVERQLQEDTELKGVVTIKSKGPACFNVKIKVGNRS